MSEDIHTNNRISATRKANSCGKKKLQTQTYQTRCYVGYYLAKLQRRCQQNLLQYSVRGGEENELCNIQSLQLDCSISTLEFVKLRFKNMCSKFNVEDIKQKHQ